MRASYLCPPLQFITAASIARATRGCRPTSWALPRPSCRRAAASAPSPAP
uniref:Uncharacterized protein n=1 Tax=Arundo donax TaxID=35708 RepID=A0A0A9CD02_ARUDO